MAKTEARTWDLLHVESRAANSDSAYATARALLKMAKGTDPSTIVLMVAYDAESDSYPGSIHFEGYDPS